MTYAEIVDAVASYGITLSEPEGFYNELDCCYEYMLQFDMNGIHIAYSWGDDPYTTESSYIAFSDMSLYK